VARGGPLVIQYKLLYHVGCLPCTSHNPDGAALLRQALRLASLLLVEEIEEKPGVSRHAALWAAPKPMKIGASARY